MLQSTLGQQTFCLRHVHERQQCQTPCFPRGDVAVDIGNRLLQGNNLNWRPDHLGAYLFEDLLREILGNERASVYDLELLREVLLSQLDGDVHCCPFQAR